MVLIKIKKTDFTEVNKADFKKANINFNPFSFLGISKNSSLDEITKKFREKIIEVKNSYEFKAKLSLAYDIMMNNQYYIKTEKKDYYKLNDKYTFIYGYFYTVVGDLPNLMKEIENNKSYIKFKDPLGRSLLFIASINGHIGICEYLINKGILVNDIDNSRNTPLHGAAYFGQLDIVKLLLGYGANINLKNKFGHLPIDEALTNEIKSVLKENEEDPILKIYKSLLSKNIAKKIVPISKYYQDNIVAKKILLNFNNLPKQYNSSEVEKEWITAWHGTKFTNLKSIAEVGLKPPGVKLDNGNEIQIPVNHIQRNINYESFPDWANGIFVSPSIFYAAHPAYSKEISFKNEQWKVLVEVRVKPNSYYETGSTCDDYKPKKNEPENLEYRIDAKDEKDVQVYSLTFVKSKFFKVPFFEEGQFLYQNIS
jgi:hypothetical protein